MIHSKLGPYLIVFLIALSICSANAFAIIGGKRVTGRKWSSAVCLTYTHDDGQEVAFGSGVLVAPDLVVTAAHCLEGEGFDPSRIRIHIGNGNDGRFVSGQFAVESFKIHPFYTLNDFTDEEGRISGYARDVFDFGYLKLERAVPDNLVSVAVVATGEEMNLLGESDTHVTIVGFGRRTTDEGSDKIGFKNELTMKLAGLNGETELDLVGAADRSSNKGDSGGPAFAQMRDGTWRLVGICSRGDQAGHSVYGVARQVVGWAQWDSGVLDSVDIDELVVPYEVANEKMLESKRLLASSNIQKAVSEAKKVLAITPFNPEAHSLLAKTYHYMNDFDNSAKHASEAYELDPFQNARVYAVSLIMEGHYKAAEAMVREAQLLSSEWSDDLLLEFIRLARDRNELTPMKEVEAVEELVQLVSGSLIPANATSSNSVLAKLGGVWHQSAFQEHATSTTAKQSLGNWQEGAIDLINAALDEHGMMGIYPRLEKQLLERFPDFEDTAVGLNTRVSLRVDSEHLGLNINNSWARYFVFTATIDDRHYDITSDCFKIYKSYDPFIIVNSLMVPLDWIQSVGVSQDSRGLSRLNIEIIGGMMPRSGKSAYIKSDVIQSLDGDLPKEYYESITPLIKPRLDNKRNHNGSWTGLYWSHSLYSILRSDSEQENVDIAARFLFTHLLSGKAKQLLPLTELGPMVLQFDPESPSEFYSNNNVVNSIANDGWIKLASDRLSSSARVRERSAVVRLSIPVKIEYSVMEHKVDQLSRALFTERNILLMNNDTFPLWPEVLLSEYVQQPESERHRRKLLLGLLIQAKAQRISTSSMQLAWQQLSKAKVEE